ncbi:type III endosome membrane protein TEMP precursor [Callorhinchus milii]|uniref:Leucine rich repeat containing 19 n=1 Tax=Callorhinchus milii TaxID=7868 RepID=K4G0F4_CALMI|nr:type III endosome membrane protein TEMP precursor [Callorhinchus milii]AFK11171.1 leucine rich repeat containing 19 [Callorhinchus milii]|eukprot:gi/632940359/ref/XP_007885275.1/ PREDICTED: putative uncharacterized protein C1orf210 homolog [Callorhinchus milii]
MRRIRCHDWVTMAFCMGFLMTVLHASPCEINNEGTANCNGRKLLNIPKDLPANLTSLDLSHNWVNVSDPDNCRQLQAFKILIFLNLSNNHIPTLNRGIFTDMKTLKLLDLSHNNMASLHPGAFQGLSSLHILILRNNRIKNVTPELLNGMQKLMTLDLANNRLTTVTTQLLQKFSALQEVQLKGNPWVCDCSLYPLQQWLMTRNDSMEDIQCGHPPDLPGRTILTMLCPITGARMIRGIRIPRNTNNSTSTAPYVSIATSPSPPTKSANTLRVLLGVLVTAILLSVLIAIAAKCKLFHKYLASYSHQLLPEQDNCSAIVTISNSGERQTIGAQVMFPPPGLDEDDGYIEDNYIQTEVREEEDDDELHVAI